MSEISPQDLCIRADYKPRLNVSHWDDTSWKGEHQSEEYRTAAEIFSRRQLLSVLDWGCGSAFKLRTFFPSTAIKIGVDGPATVDWLRREYPDGTWETNEQTAVTETDMLLCIDCIEHCTNPLLVLYRLARIQFKVGFISTPNRDAVRGEKDAGPPANESHAWEWSKEEFKSLISKFFSIQNHVDMPCGGQMIEFAPIARPHAELVVSIIAKTFCRPYLAKRLHDSIRSFYPTIPLVIADDGAPYASGFDSNTTHLRLPFDCGLKMGRNLALALVRTKYFVLCDDDFIFTAGTQLDRLILLMEQNGFDVLGADVRGEDEERQNNYRLNLEIKDGELIANRALGGELGTCDMVTNFYIAQTDTFRKFGGWDSRLKIGGHEELFLRLKRLGAKVGYVNSVWVKHQQDFSFGGDVATFEKFRNERVFDFWPPIALKEYGITRCREWECHKDWKGYDRYK